MSDLIVQMSVHAGGRAEPLRRRPIRLGQAAHVVAVMMWAGMPHYGPFVFLPPQRPYEVTASTPLLGADADAAAPIAHSARSSEDDVFCRSEEVTPFARRVYGGVASPKRGRAHDASAALRMQVACGVQAYSRSDTVHAQALLSAAIVSAQRYDVPLSALFDTGPTSPLSMILLHADVVTAQKLVDANALVTCDDLPLVLACVAAKDTPLLSAIMARKMPAATQEAADSELTRTQDPMLRVLAAIFDTQDAAFIADALCALLQDGDTFGAAVIALWRAMCPNFATLSTPLTCEAWVTWLRRAPRDRLFAAKARVSRTSITQGLCLSVLQSPDALTVLQQMPLRVRQCARTLAWQLGHVSLCRGLVDHEASLNHRE